MRIAFLGMQRAGVECLKYLVESGENVVCVIPNKNENGSWYPSIVEYAESQNIEVFAPKRISSVKSVEYLKTLDIDLMFSVQYDQILRQNVIDVPNLACLNLHFALLPKYRGCAPIAWNLINGEEYAGATVHYIDPGVDTGDVVSQMKVKIEDSDTAYSLYQKVTDVSIKLFKHTFSTIKDGSFPRMPQSDIDSLYYNMHALDFKKKQVDWTKSNDALFNWIRGYIFDPIQFPYFTFKGQNALVKRISRNVTKEVKGDEFQIVGIEGNNVSVQLRGEIFTLEIDNFSECSFKVGDLVTD